MIVALIKMVMVKTERKGRIFKTTNESFSREDLEFRNVCICMVWVVVLASQCLGSASVFNSISNLPTMDETVLKK